MANLINYVGRTVDVAAFQNVSAIQKTLLDQALASPGKSGTMLTGIAKLGQRFLLELLTEQESMPFLSNRGCSFMTEARLGQIRTQIDLSAALSRALLDVERNLTAEESDSDPDDEKYGSAEIDSVEYSGNGAKVAIRLSSQDPDAQIILPVALVI